MMTRFDQRRHPRYIPSAKTFVYTAESFGRIMDISAGGFSLFYVDVESAVKRREHVDIFLGNLSLPQVPVSVVWKAEASGAETKSVILSRVGLKFAGLTSQQRKMIDFFLSKYGSGVA